MNKILPILIVGAIAAYFVLQNAVTSTYSPSATSTEPEAQVFTGPVAPDWAAIAAWPNLQSETVEALPDPNRRVTAIVLDDSGSMEADIVAAKRAVVDALGAMDDTDRVAVLALNAGVVLPFTDVGTAKTSIATALRPVQSNGTTPLTQAVQDARSLLETEAASVRGFGTFRMIVTTDGVADDGAALANAVADLAKSTPIQLTTIGIGIDGRHVLQRSDLGAYVDVANVDALQGALEAAVAENADFTAITDFTADEG